MKSETFWKFGKATPMQKRRAVRMLWRAYVATKDGNTDRSHDIQRYFKEEFAHILGDDTCESMLQQCLLYHEYLKALKNEVRA